MAYIKKENENIVFELLPHRMENVSEEWVITKLILRSKTVSFKTIGAFLEINELNSLIQGSRKLLLNKISIFELESIEPNFSYTAELNINNTFSITCSYSEIPEEKDNVIKFNVDCTTFETFLEELSQNILQIKPANSLP